MMKCQRCGNDILDDNIFCTKCGWCKDDILRKKIKRNRIVSVLALMCICILVALVIDIIISSRNVTIKNVKMLKDYDSSTLIDDIASVSFGNYMQSDITGNKMDPIEWIVLDRDIIGRKALLISKYILDDDSCNMNNEIAGWENCNLRKWLNETFYDQAFSVEEKARIVDTMLANKDNEDYDTLAGNDTVDKVFFLSIDEAKKYFRSSKDEAYRDQLGIFAATKGTEFAKKGLSSNDKKRKQNRLDFVGKNNRESNSDVEEGKEWTIGFSDYWLRSPGGEQRVAACIKADAYLDTGGRRAHANEVGIRPAIWVKY